MLKKSFAALVFAGSFALMIAPAGAASDDAQRYEDGTELSTGHQPVDENIICNDGTMSPTCEVCRQGCCSHHGGCR